MSLDQFSSSKVGVEFDLKSIMAQKGNENFSVALRVLPARQRSHLLAIYGFARLVDDIGDELVGNRLAALDWLEAELRRARSATATHPVMRNLTGLLNDLEISDEPFLALIEANRRDQCKNRYQSQAELAEYCMLSANPVGWLVLAVFGVATPDRIALSDAVCTGLQIIEHLQDLGEDYTQKQRIYMPADEMVRFGVAEADLSAERASPQLCQLVAHQVSAARGLVNRGKLLVGSLNGWVKVAVAGYVAGGLAALDAISVGQNDVLSKLRSPARIRIVIYMVGLLMPPSLSRWVRR